MKKQDRKLKLSKQTLRTLKPSTLGHVAGGATETLSDGCTPYPSHGPCSLDGCGNSAGIRCY